MEDETLDRLDLRKRQARRDYICHQCGKGIKKGEAYFRDQCSSSNPGTPYCQISCAKLHIAWEHLLAEKGINREDIFQAHIVWGFIFAAYWADGNPYLAFDFPPSTAIVKVNGQRVYGKDSPVRLREQNMLSVEDGVERTEKRSITFSA